MITYIRFIEDTKDQKYIHPSSFVYCGSSGGCPRSRLNNLYRCFWDNQLTELVIIEYVNRLGNEGDKSKSCVMHSAWFGWVVRICPPVFSLGLVIGKLKQIIFNCNIRFPLGLSTLTAKIRMSEGLSPWFCYFIPVQILLNWIQFLRHRSFVPVSTDNYPGYVHK